MCDEQLRNLSGSTNHRPYDRRTWIAVAAALAVGTASADTTPLSYCGTYVPTSNETYTYPNKISVGQSQIAWFFTAETYLGNVREVELGSMGELCVQAADVGAFSQAWGVFWMKQLNGSMVSIEYRLSEGSGSCNPNSTFNGTNLHPGAMLYTRTSTQCGGVASVAVSLLLALLAIVSARMN